MTDPQLWLAIGPSIVAICVALIGAVVQWRTRKADDQRLKDQRAADDKRWIDQREADEKRWNSQREAEEKRLVDEHQRALDLRQREAAAEVARHKREQFRAESVSYLSALGEALAALHKTSSRFGEIAAKCDWGRQEYWLAPWSHEIETRLVVATARIQLFGGDVGNAAAHNLAKVRAAIEKMTTNERLQLGAPVNTENLNDCPADFAFFAESELERLSEQSMKGDHGVQPPGHRPS